METTLTPELLAIRDAGRAWIDAYAAYLAYPEEAHRQEALREAEARFTDALAKTAGGAR